MHLLLEIIIYLKTNKTLINMKCLIIHRILSDARDLSVFPSLNGTSALEILRLDRASLTGVPPTLCETCPKLKSL